MSNDLPSSDDLGYPRRPDNGYPAQQGPNPPAQYPTQPYQQPYGQQQYQLPPGQSYPQQQPYQQQYPQQQYPQMMVAPKSPAVAVIASFFIPGLGSMISGRAGIGVLILCLYIVSWILTIVVIGFVGLIGFWIWGMIQGYADAVAWNRSHGIIS